MKDKLVYVLVFGVTFILVTMGTIYLNTIFTNMFEFDFSSAAELEPAKEVVQSEQSSVSNFSDSLHSSIINSILDSLKSSQKDFDSVQAAIIPDSILSDSIIKLEKKISQLAAVEIKNEVKADSIKSNVKPVITAISSKDSTYKNWIKKTVSFYESMDSKKAAKIIQTYSDNVAKDLLYTMKKKKAAEILSQLNPETVNRIISPK